jgi:hypothetical protein
VILITNPAATSPSPSKEPSTIAQLLQLERGSDRIIKMARSEYELGAVSSPDDEHPCVPKTHPTNEVTVQDSPRSSITMREPAASVIPSRFFPFLILIMYSLLALLSWILLCVMSKRPIKGERTYTETESSRGERRFATNEKYYTAARILQSVVGLLTIPVTSAICSIACVAYMQTGRLRKSLTLRQAMAMADQGWINPRMWTRLASKGSLPLYVAFTLTLIGECQYPTEALWRY